MASPSLRDRLLDGVEVLTQEEFRNRFNPEADFGYGDTLFGDDSPTGQPMIVLNYEQMEEDGFGGDYQEKMILGESLHNLKNVDPERYARLKFAALSEPEVDRWLKESYAREQQPPPIGRNERRPFDQWLDVSRLDQVIGGFLFAGDPDVRHEDWDRERLPFGKDFRRQLELLERDLGLSQ